jgi:hypothetical protein
VQVIFCDDTIVVKVVHVEDEFEFGLERGIVNSEHCLHEFLLIDVLLVVWHWD